MPPRPREWPNARQPGAGPIPNSAFSSSNVGDMVGRAIVVRDVLPDRDQSLVDGAIALYGPAQTDLPFGYDSGLLG